MGGFKRCSNIDKAFKMLKVNAHKNYNISLIVTICNGKRMGAMVFCCESFLNIQTDLRSDDPKSTCPSEHVGQLGLH